MDMARPSPEKFEIGIISRDAAGKVVQKRLEGEELSQLLSEARVFEEIENARR